MAVKIPDFDINDLRDRYLAGEKVPAIARDIGISPATAYKRLRKLGVMRTAKESRKLGDKPDVPWHAEAIRLHLEGVSQTEIGKRVGVTQASVSRALLDAGYRTDRGAAERRKWARMTADERAAQVKAAHDAARGMVRNETDLFSRALTKQERQSHATDEERGVAKLIADRGYEPVLQQAIGKYNIDISVSPVAVELFGGGWHAHGRHRARLPQRMVDLANAGFNTLIIWTHTVHPLDMSVAADEVVSYVERASIDPSLRRQYRVVWGDGKFIAAGCVDDDDPTYVPSGIRGAYAGGS